MNKSRAVAVTASLIVLSSLSGCGTAWVKARYQDGGVIGYKNYSSGEEAAKGINKLIHCPNHTVVSDVMQSQEFVYTTTQAVNSQTNYNGTVTSWNSGNAYQLSGTQHTTTYVPVQNVGVSNWRELTYRCDVASSSLPSTASYVSEPPPDADNAHPDFLKSTIDYVKGLRSASASPDKANYRDGFGQYPLHAAVVLRDVNAAKKLIAAGAMVNVQNVNDWTALMQACKQGDDQMAAFLIKSGADTSVSDNFGTTAEKLAAKSGNAKLIGLLRAAAKRIPAAN